MRKSIYVFFISILYSSVTFGQADTSQAAIDKMIPVIPAEQQYPVALYQEATKQTQNLYIGRVYYIYDAREEEHQFFSQRKWYSGTIVFDGQRFDKVPLLYDTNMDELVLRHMHGDPIILAAEKVSYFTCYGQVFKWFESGKGIDSTMRTGFYNLYYNGKTQLLIRRTKQRQEKIADKRVITQFPEKDFYYIKKDNKFYAVRSKKSVLRLFPDRKRELRRVLRNENIFYRKERALAIGRMVATYDSLTNL